MKRKQFWIIFMLISVLSLIIVACSADSRDRSAAAYAPPAGELKTRDLHASADEKTEEGASPEAWEEQPRFDDQGAIMVEITPLNINAPGETLDFAVSLNTHSVDLSMDLAPLATLTTDAGLSAQALAWEAPMGGHHLSGTLSFPASVDNASLLSGADKLVLTLVKLDAPERIFEWER